MKSNNPQSNALWALAFVTVGIVLLIYGMAATPTKSLEVEAGSSSPNLSETNLSASGGQAIRFRALAASSFNINDWLVADDTPPQYSTVLVRGEREGNFRNVCWASHLNYDDPIVYPGQQGKAHLHMFFGNTNSSYLSTEASLLNSGDGTCSGGPINRSAYWIPALMDTSGKARIASVINVYYKTQNVSRLSMNYLPAGLRMIAGDSKAMSAQSYDTLHYEWNCVDGSVTKQSLIPNCAPGRAEDNKGLQLVLSFPQCWDGVNKDSTDHKSHMAYHENGLCPPDHPVALPEVTYNILWSNSDTSTNGWYLSSDKMTMSDGTVMSMPGGMTAHADWFGGWEDSIMRTFVDKCLKDGKDSNWARLCDGRRLKAVPSYNPTDIATPPATKSSQVNLPHPF